MSWLPVALALTFLLAAAGAAYQAVGRSRDARNHPAPGRLVDVDGRRFHIAEAGAGEPAVILEAGIAASSLSWILIQQRVAAFTRVCSYDRAGLGWSDARPARRTLEQSLAELRALLAAARVAPPYVLVGHSYGGLLARAFAARYPAETCGVVLLDPVSVTEWSAPGAERRAELQKGVLLARRGAFLARFGLVRLSLSMLLSGATRLPRLIAKASAGRGESVASRLVNEVRKLPQERWSTVRAHWCDPKCFRGMAAHLAELPANAAALAQIEEPLSAPLVIVSAANAKPIEIRERDDLAARSPAGSHIVAANSGHWVQLDEPELVIDAIRGVVDRARALAAR